MQQLANAIQTQLETLVDQYDARLQTMPGYVNFPAAARRDLERQMLNLMVQCLIAGDSHQLIEYSRQRATQWAELGLDLVSMGGLVHQSRWADLSMEITELDRGLE